MDGSNLLVMVRYVELNPVRARRIERPADYIRSRAAAHLAGRDDALVKVGPLLRLVGDWVTFLSQGLGAADAETLRKHERTGRPLGDEGFVERLETTLGRPLRKSKPGPKKRKA